MASAKNNARFSQNQSLAILFLAILLTNLFPRLLKKIFFNLCFHPNYVSGTERSHGKTRFFNIFQSHFRQQPPWACICPLCLKSPSFRTVRKVCWSSWYSNSPHRLENRWHTWTGLSLTLESVEPSLACCTWPQWYFLCLLLSLLDCIVC